MSGSDMVKAGSGRWKIVVMAILVVATVALASSSAYGSAVVEVEKGVPEAIDLDAGEGCAFPVTLTPLDGATETVTAYADGRVRIRVVADYEVSDGTSTLVHRSRYTTVEQAISDDEERWTTTGRGIVFLFPGDAGPNGEVGDDGGLYAITGRLRQTYEADEDLVTGFALRGRATDLCAALSG